MMSLNSTSEHFRPLFTDRGNKDRAKTVPPETGLNRPTSGIIGEDFPLGFPFFQIGFPFKNGVVAEEGKAS